MKVVLDDNVFSVIGSDYRLEHLLIYLFRNSDKDGILVSTYRLLEKEVGIARATLSRCIKTLEDGGILMVKKNLPQMLMGQHLGQGATMLTVCNIRRLRGMSNVNGTTLGTTERTVSKFSFEALWDLYKKKEGPKLKLKSKWNTFDEETRQRVFEFVPKYVALTEYKYRQMLSTFLNQRTWENETISVGSECISISDFNANLLIDGEGSLFYRFIQHFNDMINGTKIPPVDLKNGLTEERRVMFNIAYCLKFHQMKLVMEKTIHSPRLNGTRGFAANYDFIFNPQNFQKIYEGVYD